MGVSDEDYAAAQACYNGRCGCAGEGCEDLEEAFARVQADFIAELQSHDCTRERCGPVCTAFEW